MTNLTSTKSSRENVLNIVCKTNLLAEQLKLAVIRQDNLTKDCFEKCISKGNDSNPKGKLTVRQTEVLPEAKRTGDFRSNDILNVNEEAENNSCPSETATRTTNLKDISIEDKKIAENLKAKLHILKLLSGIRFDINIPGNILSGYIGFSTNKPHKSAFVPFEIDKNNSNIEHILWAKINQACSEIDVSIK